MIVLKECSSLPNNPIKRGYKIWEGLIQMGLCVSTKFDQSCFDNFFNYVELQQNLSSNGISASVTVRKGKKQFTTTKG